jgi:tRNA threonylcarbamoyl adenosine modification protein YeaZ
VRALIIDTSSVVSVAAIETGPDAAVVLSRSNGSDTHRHAEDVAPAVAQVLKAAGWDRPDIVVTGEGPGPFTGLRVGMATAEALAFAWGVDVTGCCSLDGLAHGLVGVEGTEQGFVAALDARRKELYWARYDAGGVRVDGPHVSAAGALPEGVPVAGAGVAARATEFHELGANIVPGTEHRFVDAGELGRFWAAAGEPLTTPRARYLRESDAVVPKSMDGVDVSRPGTTA